MKQELQRMMNRKSFHIAILLGIVFIMLVLLGFVVLRYSVEGETNMPFKLSKISIISSAEGKSEKNSENNMHFNIDQNNDIYLYIEKNAEYQGIEAIEGITIDNIKMSKNNEKGSLHIYKPDAASTDTIFSNKEELETNTFNYEVSNNSDMKNLKITNQGGLLVLRLANQDIAQCDIEYQAQVDGNGINYNELLQKADVTQEDLQANLQFDLTIKLQSLKSFKSTISLDLPLKNVIEQGTASEEITDTEKFVFKRQKP